MYICKAYSILDVKCYSATVGRSNTVCRLVIRVVSPARRTLRYEASVVWSGWVDELPEGYREASGAKLKRRVIRYLDVTVYPIKARRTVFRELAHTRLYLTF